MREMRKALENEILEQEVRLEDIRQRKKPKTMEEVRPKNREEKKQPNANQTMANLNSHRLTCPTTPKK